MRKYLFEIFAVVMLIIAVFSALTMQNRYPQSEPTNTSAVQVEASDEIAARYHLRGRVNHFFKRSCRA